MFDMLLRFVSKPVFFVFLAVIAFIICLDIEYRWVLFPTNSIEYANITNKIILAFSYSYISATIFHLIVNYFPNKFRSKKLSPFIQNQLFRIRELLRQSKIIVLPPFELMNTNYQKDEFIKLFNKTNFYDEYEFHKGQTKFERMEINRNKINDLISILLCYREHLSEKQFSFLIDLQNCEFIANGLYPFIVNNNYDYCNQETVGECIYDFYEKSLLLS